MRGRSVRRRARRLHEARRRRASPASPRSARRCRISRTASSSRATRTSSACRSARIIHSFDDDAVALWNANFEQGVKIAKATGAKEVWPARGRDADHPSDGRHDHGNERGELGDQQLRPDPRNRRTCGWPGPASSRPRARRTRPTRSSRCRSAAPRIWRRTKEAETLEALGEALVPGASRPASRISSISRSRCRRRRRCCRRASSTCKPPFANFYRAAVRRHRRGQRQALSRKFAMLSAGDKHDFVNLHAPEQARGLAGPAAGLVYFVLRSDAVDVVYSHHGGLRGASAFRTWPTSRPSGGGDMATQRKGRCRHRRRRRVRLGLCRGAGQGRQEGGPARQRAGLAAHRPDQLGFLGPPDQAGGRARSCSKASIRSATPPGRLGRRRRGAALLRQLPAAVCRPTTRSRASTTAPTTGRSPMTTSRRSTTRSRPRSASPATPRRKSYGGRPASPIRCRR